MMIYVFVSDFDPRLRAFTCDATGNNLPERDRMLWRQQNGGHAISIDERLLPVTDAVRKDGYMLIITRDDGPSTVYTVH
jgi:hypothetical protein